MALEVQMKYESFVVYFLPKFGGRLLPKIKDIALCFWRSFDDFDQGVEYGPLAFDNGNCACPVLKIAQRFPKTVHDSFTNNGQPRNNL